MAYDKQKIYEQAIEVATKKKLFFIEQVIAFLPITKPTFYDYFKVDSDEFNVIKTILDNNRIEVSSAMYKKWYDSDNATLQVSLMKIIGSDEARRALSTNWNENKHSFDETKPQINISIDGKLIE